MEGAAAGVGSSTSIRSELLSVLLSVICQLYVSTWNCVVADTRAHYVSPFNTAARSPHVHSRLFGAEFQWLCISHRTEPCCHYPSARSSSASTRLYRSGEGKCAEAGVGVAGAFAAAAMAAAC